MHEYGLTNSKGEIILCPIDKGTCPYDNEGRSIPVRRVTFSECVTSGLVAKAGRIKNSTPFYRHTLRKSSRLSLFHS